MPTQNESLEYAISMIEGHECCWLTEEDEAEKDAHVVNLRALMCICAEPLREGDILAPCPVHGWVTH